MVDPNSDVKNKSGITNISSNITSGIGSGMSLRQASDRMSKASGPSLMTSKSGDRSGTPYETLSKGDADVFTPGKVQVLNGAGDQVPPTYAPVVMNGPGSPVSTDDSEFGGPMDTSSVSLAPGQVGASTGQPMPLDFGKMEAPVVPANMSPDPAFGLSMPGLGAQVKRPMYSDEKLKKNVVSLSDAAKMDPDSRMLFGRDDAASNQARRMFNSQEAMYASKSPVADTLRNTDAYSFEYKPQVQGMAGQKPGDKNVGIMAQDLERTPAGKTLVKDEQQGKVIDAKKAIGFSLAAASELQKQVDRQNAELARLKAQQTGGVQLSSPGVGSMRVADQGPVGPNEAYTRTRYVPVQPEPYAPMRPRRTMDGDY